MTETWAVVGKWACMHPMALVWVGIVFVITLAVIQEIIRLDKEPLMGSFDDFRDPGPDPLRPEWVHRDMVLTDHTGDKWEVTFVGTDFVTVGKTKNVSYDELRDWAVFA